MTQERRFDESVGRTYSLEEYIRDCYGGLPNESMLEEQWKKLPICKDYDSTADTLKHIKRVNELLSGAAMELLRRGNVHDNSKLESPEKELFDRYTPLLAGSTYGSPEYMGYLEHLKDALGHHYAHNSHHPEHYIDGVDDMDLFDIIEMFFDWKAASERHDDGDIYKSIKLNRKRFAMSKQLANIFENTAKFLRWEK